MRALVGLSVPRSRVTGEFKEEAVKKNLLTCIVAMTLFGSLAIPVRLAAQEQKVGKGHHRYKLIDLGTLDGPTSYLANDNTAGSASGVLNNRGTVVGAADTSLPNPNYPNCCIIGPFDPFIFHAFQWRDGVVTDLGTLPGGNNSFTNWISAKGLIAGFSENGAIDPLLGVPETHAVLWKHSEIIDLGTLEGGHESQAFAVNDKGQVVGAALNTIPDPFDPIFVTQIRAFLWQDGVMKDLGTLGGSEALAFLVNERGQVAGFSFTNSTPNASTGMPTQDPFLWENGKMVDLGTLGGTVGVANALNNRGQVVGQSNLAGDLTTHPFLWDRGVLTDLGTLGGDFGSAHWINDAGKIVGFASTSGDQALHGFLWNDGVITDLGTVNNEPCSTAQGINSKNQIVGISFNCIAGGFAWLWENGGPIVDLNTLVLPRV
jgi:probable HAF family extracellular repeat protein